MATRTATNMAAALLWIRVAWPSLALRVPTQRCGRPVMDDVGSSGWALLGCVSDWQLQGCVSGWQLQGCVSDWQLQGCVSGWQLRCCGCSVIEPSTGACNVAPCMNAVFSASRHPNCQLLGDAARSAYQSNLY